MWGSKTERASQHKNSGKHSSELLRTKMRLIVQFLCKLRHFELNSRLLVGPH